MHFNQLLKFEEPATTLPPVPGSEEPQTPFGRIGATDSIHARGTSQDQKALATIYKYAPQLEAERAQLANSNASEEQWAQHAQNVINFMKQTPALSSKISGDLWRNFTPQQMIKYSGAMSPTKPAAQTEPDSYSSVTTAENSFDNSFSMARNNGESQFYFEGNSQHPAGYYSTDLAATDPGKESLQYTTSYMKNGNEYARTTSGTGTVGTVNYGSVKPTINAALKTADLQINKI